MAGGGGGDIPRQLKLSQSGRVSAVQSVQNGSATSEIRVRSDCLPMTLMSDTSKSIVQDSRPTGGAPLVGGFGETAPPVLLAQLGECSHQRGGSGELRMISGRLLLRGESVIVSGKTAHFSENSQLVGHSGSGGTDTTSADTSGQPRAPSLVGEPVGDLLACVGTDLDGACLFYGRGASECGVLQLGCRQALLRRPQLHLAGRILPLDSVVRVSAAAARVQPAGPEDTTAVAAAATAAAAAADATASSMHHLRHRPLKLQAPQQSSSPPRRILLLLGGRCLLKGDFLLILSGLLHFSGTWHRVSQSVGCQPPWISGTSVLRRLRPQEPVQDLATSTDDTDPDTDDDPAMEHAIAAALDRPIVLSNVWLYAQGGTVFVGQTPLMSGAALTMSTGTPKTPLEHQDLLAPESRPSARRDPPCRLFLQSGSFSVVASGGVLRAFAGVAWMRAKKTRLHGGGKQQQSLTIRDALVFVQPPPGASPQDPIRFEGRDLLYKEGLLFLDDLTPLLAGGRVCLDHLEVPLDWLSGIEDDNRPSLSSDTLASDTGVGSDGTSIQDLLTDGECLLESNGCLHLLRGRLSLPTEPGPVLIDQGVAHFGPGSQIPTHQSAGFPPPRIVGRAMTHPRETRRWASYVDTRLGRAVFTGARLSMRGGILWLNDQVPLLNACRLLINSRCYRRLSQSAEQADPNKEDGPWQMSGQTSCGLAGSYTVFAKASQESEGLVFSLKAKINSDLQFLFSETA